MTQSEKGHAFRALHTGAGAFIIPNPWDAGTARMLSRLGFQALATTSMGYAFSRGRQDGAVSRDEMLKHVSEIATATELPVSADLEHGYGDSPEIVSETVRLAAGTGIAGCSIEDATGRSDHPIYEKEHATERMRAAVEAARKLPFPFTLTGRAENYLYGRPDVKDTIARLQAYQDAGADVLYAPGLTSKEEIAAVVSSLDRPVNAVMGLRGVLLSLEELSGLGVKRVSLGSCLFRYAIGAFLRAAREMRDCGTFSFTEQSASPLEIGAMIER